MPTNDTTMRLQKYLAERGVASRRAAAQLIAQGRVRLNGRTVKAPGIRLTPGKDHVHVDDAPLSHSLAPRRTVMLYKPRGVVCTRSQREGRTVYDLLGSVRERLVPVGRLDKNSEGLLLLSNDGDLVSRLTHPRYEHEKEYRVTVSGHVGAAELDVMRSPLLIEGRPIQPADVQVLKKGHKPDRTVLRVVLREGRKRQIRQMCEQANLKVHRLARVRVGNLRLAGLKPGEWKELRPAELRALLQS